MGQIFQNFIAGNQAGREEGEARRRQNALEQAGQAYAAGDAEQGSNALVAAGLYNEAGAMSTLSEAQRTRRARTRAQEAAQALGPDADPSALVRAQSQSYFQGGDVEQGANLFNIYHQMDESQRQQSLAAHDGIASFSLGLIQSGVPEDQRQAQALAHAQDFSEQTGIPVDQVQQMVQRQTDWSDTGLQALAAQHRSASDQLSEITRQRERGEDNTRQDRQQERAFGLQERALSIQARNSAPDNQRPLPPGALATARSSMAAATRLRTSYNSFLEMLRNASPQALAGIGPEGAALQSAHRLLAIQAKSPAALDLGALVGADFNILNDILGEPGNIRQLVQQGGQPGALRRLEPFDQFLDAGLEGLRQTYQPWSAQMPEFYQDAATPAATDTPDVPAAPATRVTNASNYQRALAAFDAGPDTPERRAAFAQASGGTSVDEARIITSSLRRR